GVAIDPTSARLCAPCDGELIVIAAARHAVTLRTPEGCEVLLHVGIDSVELGGQGFELHAPQGARVRAGEPLLSFDLDLLARRAARTRGQRAQHRGADGARRRARGGDRDPCHRARRHGRRAGAGCGAGRDAVVRLGLAGLQKVGGALMLPIAVLPIAGLLLRLGQPDLLDSASVAAAGAAIFSNLGLLFAIGVAVGLARENHGAAGLASVVAYLVATRGA